MLSHLLLAESWDGRDDYIVKPMAKALQVLTARMKSEHELSLPEIGGWVGILKATIKRCLQTRVQNGLVRPDPSIAGQVRLLAPILDGRGRSIAAISLSAPATRLDDDQFDSVAAQVRRTAMNISLLLGHLPSLPLS
jgi:DNA-binding IclR family transcriptional regulator